MLRAASDTVCILPACRCYTMFERVSEEQKEDRNFLRRWSWSHMVLDEAHAVKNRYSCAAARVPRAAYSAFQWTTCGRNGFFPQKTSLSAHVMSIKPVLSPARARECAHRYVPGDAPSSNCFGYCAPAMTLLDRRNATRTQRLRSLAGRCRRRIMLTGTPLQNDLAELQNLLSFLLPTLFTDDVAGRLADNKVCASMLACAISHGAQYVPPAIRFALSAGVAEG